MPVQERATTVVFGLALMAVVFLAIVSPWMLFFLLAAGFVSVLLSLWITGGS